MAYFLEAMAALQQRFRWNAADVQARAAEEFALHAGDAHAELRGADGGDVSAGAGADHDQIKVVSHGARIVRAIKPPATSCASRLPARRQTRGGEWRPRDKAGRGIRAGRSFPRRLRSA